MVLVLRYSLRNILPIFILAMLFFVLILQIVEVVINLISYIQLNIAIIDILRVLWFAMPRTVVYALPISILFSISFTIGTLHGNNELQAVFGIGTSLGQFCIPIVMFAAIISGAALLFEDRVVVPTQYQYSLLKESLLLTNASEDNTNIAVFGEDGLDVYYADFFDVNDQRLDELIIIDRNIQGDIIRRIDARSAQWLEEEGHWQLSEVVTYTWAEDDAVALEQFQVVNSPNFTIPPATFGSAVREVDELNLTELNAHIDNLQRRGLPYRRELTQYYERFAFSSTSLVLAIIACGIGALLRRNTLILSMVLALCSSIVYYVLGLVCNLLAYSAVISPLVASFFPVFFFVVLGVVVITRYAKT